MNIVTAEKFYLHGNLLVPACGSYLYKSCHYRWDEVVADLLMIIRVALEYLRKAKKTEVENHDE